VVVTVITTFKSGGDKSPSSHTKLRLWLWWQQFLLIFLRTNVIFCPKASLISYGGSSSSQGGALLGVFLLGQSPSLPCEVGASLSSHNL